MRWKAWTSQEIEFLKSNYKKLTDVQIGEKLKRGHWSITWKRRKLGLKIEGKVLTERTIQSQKNSTQKKQDKKRKHKFGQMSIYSIVYLSYSKRILKLRFKQVPMERILEEISEIFGISIDSIKGNSKKDEIVFCRQLFCFVTKKLFPKKSLFDISKYLGYRDHSMAIYAINKIRQSIKIEDPAFMPDWYRYINQSEIFKK